MISQPIAFGRAFGALFDEHPQPVWVFATRDLKIIAANRAALALYGYAETEFLTLTALQLRPPEEQQFLLDALKRPLPTLANPATARHQRKDGTVFEVEAVAIEMPLLNQCLRLVMVNDVTERNRISKEAAIADGRYRQLVERASDSVFAIDQNGRFLAANDACQRLTGYSHDELSRISIFDLLAPEYRERSRRAWMSGSASVADVGLRTKHGELLMVQISCSKSTTEGRPEFQGIARDVTERFQEARFDNGRRKVLEMLTRGDPLVKILSAICEIVEERLGDVLCSIAAPAGGNSEQVVWSPARTETISSVVPRDLQAQKKRVLARNDKTGITLSAVVESGSPAAAYPYCWTISGQKSSVHPAADLVIYRQTHTAPSDHEVGLLHRITDLIEVVVEHDRLIAQMRHQANHDALTGLPNRLSFRKHLAEAIANAEKSGTSVGLLHIDLDDFNLVNDSEGHLAGDELLNEVAVRLRNQLGHSIMLARTGGDEFCIVLRDIECEEDITSLAKRIIKAMRKPFDLDSRDQFLSVTMGISLYPRDGATAGDLINCADVALYRRKTEGKGGFLTYRPEMAQAAARRQAIQNRLHHAAEHTEQFSIAFQPQIELKNRALSGFEALLRWTAPGLGEVSPSEFIPVAEESGLILRIGKWTLLEACRSAQQWREQGGAAVRVAVNVSARQFAQPNFIDTLTKALQETGLNPANLELELTETVVMRSFHDSVRKFASLRDLGIAISIDDFGTGYSSLSYLEQLPVDTLKIDASFTRRIVPGVAPPALVQAIVGLAHNLGMNVIAEGIESEYQLEVLRDLGCDKGQGYWISRAVAPDSVLRMLRDPGYLRQAIPSCNGSVDNLLRLLKGCEGNGMADPASLDVSSACV